ncbi:MAG TPA: biopolymer transporter ExbD [Thermoanaerobaculia bacterium]|nr:biopolymer transporter ExbD [Thermoanaerobaculia bacterium]
MLLIIFMVVTPMIVQGVPVHLPSVHNAANVGEATRQLPVTVNADGTLYVDSVVIRAEQLAGVLRERHNEHPVRGDKAGEERFRRIAAEFLAREIASLELVTL